MYAVIATGGKQRRVEPGQVLEVELLGADTGAKVSFEPVLVVDGDAVFATPAELDGSSVTAEVLGEAKGPKVRGFVYKNATTYRRRWGHRQRYTKIRIDEIAPARTAAGS
ncbi:MAG TPA: 50S ribosomal protein L21 [Acidimicrobiaceae bacterium]|nr:50S ribosomal protein L21 [Acidimicrobiaceae bacterium]HCB37468.1 50S ribosomal protein L21 [Acidimicrobiaceae bacterium]